MYDEIGIVIDKMEEAWKKRVKHAGKVDMKCDLKAHIKNEIYFLENIRGLLNGITSNNGTPSEVRKSNIVKIVIKAIDSYIDKCCRLKSKHHSGDIDWTDDE